MENHNAEPKLKEAKTDVKIPPEKVIEILKTLEGVKRTLQQLLKVE